MKPLRGKEFSVHLHKKYTLTGGGNPMPRNFYSVLIVHYTNDLLYIVNSHMAKHFLPYAQKSGGKKEICFSHPSFPLKHRPQAAITCIICNDL